MTLQKRGLGRGLEVLLADSSALKGLQQEPVAIAKMDDRTVKAQKLIENIQREHARLLEEAEALKSLLDEFESIIRAELQ
jgi:ParB-like chromosome segregation protein Spo0J